MNTTPAKANDSIDRTAANAHNTVNNLADQAKPAVDRIASGAHQAVDKAAAFAGTAAQQIGATGEKLSALQDKSLEGARSYVRNNPLTCIGLAVAAGFLVSRLTR